MRILLLTTCLLISSVSFLTAQTKDLLVLGFRDSIYSDILGEKRNLLIHLPATPADAFAPDQQYPVIFVLDGETLFQTVVAVSENASAGSGNFANPKAIVVGITNTDRTRDLTPTHWVDSSLTPAFMLASSGGGGKFLAFIEKELIPYIEATCPAAPHRTLIGHSLGGLTVINALLNRKDLFHAYVAIDPTTWWEKERWINREKKKLPGGDYSNISLFLAIAHSVDKSMSMESVRADTGIRTLPMRSELNFDRYLQSLAGSHPLIYRSKYYSDYDHGGVVVPAIYDAMGFIYDFYNVNFPFPGFFTPGYKNDDQLTDHYEMVSKRLGYRVSPPGELVNAIAHQLMGLKQFDRAKKYLDLNLQNYPGSYVPYEALGDYFRKLGEQQLSESYYMKAQAVRATTQ